MGTTVHSSFDFSSILPWLGRRQGKDSSEGNRSSLEHPSAVREFLRCRPVPAGGSSEFLEGICKSAAAQVGAAAAIVQEQILTRRFPERAVQILSEHLTPLKEALGEARAGIQKADQLPHVKMPASNRPVPRAFALACALLQSTGFDFDECAFAEAILNIQRQSSLEMSEIWLLKPFLEMVLLGRFAQEMEASGLAPSDRQTENCPVDDECFKRIDSLLETLTEIAGTEWKEFFESVCLVEETLRTDPLGAYAKMDAETREVYRTAVAELAAHSTEAETDIARKAIQLAAAAGENPVSSERSRERRTHVGYYLVGDGVTELKKQIDYKPSLVGRIRDGILKSPDLIYVAAIEVVTVAIAAALFAIFQLKFMGLIPLALVAFPAIECAVSIVNMIATRLVPPKRIPKLDFSKGIPDSCATVVAVPALLTSETQVRQAVQGLEIRYLANRDANLHFALLSDLPDSRQQFDQSESLAELASKLIQQLDQKYGRAGMGRFFLFHRHRKYNAAEGIWMGWERKRGKLLDFNRFLLHRSDEFPVKTGDISALKSIRYVITLDLDTQLPPGAARKLVATMAHPLNRAVIDPEKNTVVEGYGILQPRVDISVKSASRSRFAALLSGDTGFDIYTRAVSDVYQDLFGEGIFAGKGIYEVETFQNVLEHRFPCNTVLSHDLIEGAYVRAGLVSDVEVVDDYPSHFSAFSRRKHRWVRGDWQIIFSLLPKVKDYHGQLVANPLSYISRWKVFDNLRRSLTDTATMLLLVCGWLLAPSEALRWTLAVLALMLFPIFFEPLLSTFTAGKALLKADFWLNLGQDLAASLARFLVRVAFLCHQSLIDIDAVVRTVVRMYVTHRRLLEWETAAEAERSASGENVVDTYLKYSLLITIVIAPLVYFLHPGSFVVAMPFLTLWATSAWIGEWLNQPQRSTASILRAEDRDMVRGAALRTWRFFGEFSNPTENWLIPDFVQEDRARIAHRVSPTNLGLLLNARLAAHDLGYLTTQEFIRDTEKTLETVQAMKKWKGHLYNWYQTESLEPDKPLFVSTVDNGNLVCSLWTLKNGCLEMIRRPLLDPALKSGLYDVASQLAEAVMQHSAGDDLAEFAFDLKGRTQRIASQSSVQISELRALEIEALAVFSHVLKGGAHEDVIWWAKELESRVMGVLTLFEKLAPWLGTTIDGAASAFTQQMRRRPGRLTLESLPRMYRELSAKLDTEPAPADSDEGRKHLQAALKKSAQLAEDLVTRLQALAATADALAEAMDFSLLFDERRKVFSIGYEEPQPSISKYSYDQLASEARSAVFVAIAKHEAPQEAWFRLKRSYRKFMGENVLLSWSGTAFEYLMPCLWLRGYPNTLLDRSVRAVIRAQQAFAREHHLPWGVSESACSAKTPDDFFVYHAFGVPGLALHRDDHSDDLVVTPYATFLSMMFDLKGAVKNLREFERLGLLSPYGFYESADFTPRHNQSSDGYSIVHNWMAHHQGMIILAAANTLCDGSMQRRFHSEPRVAAIERVLHEKQPRALPYEEVEELMKEASPTRADSGGLQPVFKDLVPKAL